MNEEKLERALPLMFREVKIPKQAKEDLRQRLLKTKELSDDELEFLAAAGGERPCEVCGKDKHGQAICPYCGN